LVDSETCARLSVSEIDVDDSMRRQIQAPPSRPVVIWSIQVHGHYVGDLVIGLKLSHAAARIVVEGRDGVDTHVL